MGFNLCDVRVDRNTDRDREKTSSRQGRLDVVLLQSLRLIPAFAGMTVRQSRSR